MSNLFTKFVAKIFTTGGRVFTKAFGLAYKNAAQTQKAGGSAADTVGSFRAGMRKKMGTEEAIQILHVEVKKDGTAPDFQEIHDRYVKLFDLNDDTKGGSFYIQSKVHNAYETLKVEYPKEWEAFEVILKEQGEQEKDVKQREE